MFIFPNSVIRDFTLRNDCSNLNNNVLFNCYIVKESGIYIINNGMCVSVYFIKIKTNVPYLMERNRVQVQD